MKSDIWYGGRLTLRQPVKGFKATTDALLLAAAIPQTAQHVLELGAGVGAASLALAARLEQVKVTAIECDEEIAALLAQNITDNEMSARVVAVTGDAFDVNPLWEGRHDLVMMNPPYNDHRSTLSDDEYRKAAMATDDLGRWIKAAAKGLAPKGRLVMISRADKLDEIMRGLTPDFGDISLKPIYTTTDDAAKRVLVSARKGVEGPLSIMPSLMLDQDEYALNGGGLDMIPKGRNVGRIKLPS